MQDLVNITVLFSIYLVFSMGISMVWGSIGVLNLAHGSVLMFSAFSGYLVVEHTPLALVFVLPLCMAVAALVSVLLQLVVFEPIMKQSGTAQMAELQILIGGIGAGAVLLAIVQKATTNAPFGFTEGKFRITTYVFENFRVSNIQLMIIAAGLAVGIGTAWWMNKSRSGLALRAIGVDPETASLMGIRRVRLARMTMAVGGAYAGLAGALLTYQLGALAPESGDSFLIKAFAVIILGGVGSVVGVVSGALVLALSETLILTYTSGTWVDGVSFLVILAVLLVRPRGIFGRAEVRRT